MLQDLETSIKKTQEISEENKQRCVDRLHEIVLKYGKEVARDFNEVNWRCQVNGGLSAGYLFCLTGELDKGISFLEKSLQIHKANRDKYSQTEASLLKFVIRTLKEFDASPQTIEQYRSRLKEAKERSKRTPKDIRRKITRIEADMECATGDLDPAYSHGRREQGKLYQRLGEHEEAIRHFKKSIEEDKRDWRNETTIPNKLLIADSYLELGDTDSARDEFVGLLTLLAPKEVQPGEKLPEFLTENIEKFCPYFEKLGMSESFQKVIYYAKARFENLKSLIKTPAKKEKPEEHWKRSELCRLSGILAEDHVRREEYQQASDVFDEARGYLEYKHHLPWREQAEFAIRAGNEEKARELIKADESYKESGRFNEKKETELANLYLQLGDVDSALDLLGKHCEEYKKCLVSGSYDEVFETRRTQISILKAVIGKDYAERLRKHAKSAEGKEDLLQQGNLKFLPTGKIEKDE